MVSKRITSSGGTAVTVFSAAPLSSIRLLMSTVTKLYLFSAAIPLVIMFFALYAMTYRLTKPLKQMSEAARAMAKGDFSKRIPVTSDDEIGELAVSFNQMTNSLVQLEGMRKSFVANVSHELKTPLTSICGISDMLMNGIVKPEDVKGFGGDINREAARLLALVNDIIRLSELDEGAEDTDKAEITDILEVANDAVKSISGVAKKAGITVTAEGDSTLVNGGKSLIFEMIYNLCDNAVKYNRENGSVKVTVGSAGGSAFIRVSDTGIGIAPEHIDRIFERFYRVDKSRSKQSGGTGLGLSIVKHIALSLDGKISTESKPGYGTEITVSLPIAEK